MCLGWDSLRPMKRTPSLFAGALQNEIDGALERKKNAPFFLTSAECLMRIAAFGNISITEGRNVAWLAQHRERATNVWGMGLVGSSKRIT